MEVKGKSSSCQKVGLWDTVHYTRYVYDYDEICI